VESVPNLRPTADSKSARADTTLEIIVKAKDETISALAVEKIVYTKTLEWEHENEYRLAIPMRQNEEPWNTLPYHLEEIVELYLGLAMEKADIDRVIAMAQAVNPSVAIFKAKRGPNGRLGFD
jgi:hypothetical protein